MRHIIMWFCFEIAVRIGAEKHQNNWKKNQPNGLCEIIVYLENVA